MACLTLSPGARKPFPCTTSCCRSRAPRRRKPTVRPRILVADDNSDMRQYLARLLSEQYEVETVANGRSALQSRA